MELFDNKIKTVKTISISLIGTETSPLEYICLESFQSVQNCTDEFVQM